LAYDILLNNIRGERMIKSLKYIIFAVCLASALFAAGCSSSPSESEMKMLNDLKDQASALDKQVQNKTSEKSALEKQLADKNAKLQQCQADQEAVKKALGGK
jgi:septal ring factor EnvC (AmiA/AmiB activator)